MKLTILASMTLLAVLAGAPAAPESSGATPPSPQQTAAPDAKVLTKLLDDFLAGASRNDAAMHDRFWADDLIYTSATGTRRGKAEIMSGLRSAPPPDAASRDRGPATIYSAEDVRIQQYGDTAIVAFRLVATPAATSPAAPAPSASQPKSPSAPATQPNAPPPAATVTRFFNTGTFLKRNGEWRAVAWQATRIPDPPAVPQPR